MSLMLDMSDFISMNVGKQISSSFSFSWLDTSICVTTIGEPCEFGTTSKIVAGYLIQWNEIFSEGGLTIGVVRKTTTVGKTRMNFEPESLSTIVFPFLARWGLISRALDNIFCYLLRKLAHRLATISFFSSSSVTIGGTMWSKASIYSTSYEIVTSLKVVTYAWAWLFSTR